MTLPTLVFVQRLEVLRGRPGKPPAIRGIAAAVAGAIPSPLGFVPMHDATRVSANRRKAIERSRRRSRNGHQSPVARYDLPAAGSNLLIRVRLSAYETIDDESPHHVQILRDPLAGRRQQR